VNAYTTCSLCGMAEIRRGLAMCSACEVAERATVGHEASGSSLETLRAVYEATRLDRDNLLGEVERMRRSIDDARKLREREVRERDEARACTNAVARERDEARAIIQGMRVELELWRRNHVGLAQCGGCPACEGYG
jgi:hypothetical protein